jgi:Tfp pilus assembly protein PilN
MKAVNLLPADLRGAAPKQARSGRPEPVRGVGAYVLLGALALCVAALAAYVLVGNGIKQREADLEAAQQRATAAANKAEALKPYADFEALAKARVETVRGLAAARFDWEQALRDISHAIPADIQLETLNGDMGLPGGSASGDPLRGSIAAPAISLAGCASSQSNVARMMSRIKAVDGVTRVSLSKSEAGAENDETSCAGKAPSNFSLVAFFERSAASAALAPSTGTGGATPAVPVPKAVSGAASADGAAAPDDTGAVPQAAGDDSTTTPTTTGGTP